MRRTSLLWAGALLVIGLRDRSGDGTHRRPRGPADGSPVPGVSVVVNERSLTAITDPNGAFTFRSLPAGRYSVTFVLGTNVTTREQVEVLAGQATPLEEQVDWAVGFAESLIVYGASRKIERIVEAPAAVTIVDEKEIEQDASHGQLPKLLEYTPGAELTQSGIYDFNFNTRGFNSSLNRRVATLVDGSDPSVPFLGVPGVGGDLVSPGRSGLARAGARPERGPLRRQRFERRPQHDQQAAALQPGRNLPGERRRARHAEPRLPPRAVASGTTGTSSSWADFATRATSPSRGAASRSTRSPAPPPGR